MGAIGLYLAQEFRLANYHVRGLDFRTNKNSRKIKSTSSINGENFTLHLDIDSKINEKDDVIFICLKSYDIDDLLISKLMDSKKEVLFIQNGLLIRNKLKDITQLFAIGTITGIQSTLHNKRLDVQSLNTNIFAKLNDKTSKLAELAVGQNLPHTKLHFDSNFQIQFYCKYVRWMVTGCLNLLNSAGVGESLKQAPKEDVLLVIKELISFIDHEFGLGIDAEDILYTLYNLPKNLKTSSYRDFEKGKPTEILNELEHVVSVLKIFNTDKLMLEKWKDEILHAK